MVEWRSREKIDGILEETLADPAVLQRTYPMGWYLLRAISMSTYPHSF